ncbi:NrfD/PsrC family molybdoenzyme membrane anchor subunit [Desulfosporosinus shakirovi]|uniref:NrfD/PsrC family molybdoenzyme membrane anchor subunit n=1 Tax=Desulfosporosinus shakirovi TaxID=2885154 RepID=UPI001E56E50F|nr:NrfD/PsrC family molybdoenzyme membrane anchor subunit [Desulfosporosinus sp. SRJS8]MCB8816664.1 polysulfide reductase NrfD [Desulfosporosinus sp. SRJS8]
MITVHFFDVPHEIYWGLLIALYFYYTGMSAGSFILTSLGTVFGIEKYKKVSKVGVIMAIVLLLFAPLHLLFDLSQPGRFINLFTHVNLTSAMSWGVYLLILYPACLMIYAWFLFRQDFVKGLNQGGFKASLYRFLLFGKTDMSEASKENDKKQAKFFGTLGVPLALAVHGYTGFILGNVQARAIWHTPLMPIIFLMSAMVSGTGLFIIVLMLVEKFKFGRLNEDIKALIADIANLMKWFIVVDGALMIIYFIVLWYSSESGYAAGYFLLHNEGWSFLGLENILGMLVPLLILLSKKARQSLPAVVIASVLTIIGVLAMRINLVIGGQKLPLTGSKIVEYVTSGQDIAIVLGIALAVIVVLSFLYSVLPMNRPGAQERAEIQGNKTIPTTKGVAQ